MSTLSIATVRRKITLLLLLYFVSTLALRLSGWGNAVFFFDSPQKYQDRNALGVALYYCLPLFLFFYSRKAKKTGVLVRIYALLESAHILLQIVLSLSIVIFGAAFLSLLKLWILDVFFLGQTILLFRNAGKLMQLEKESATEDETSENSFRKRALAMGLWMLFCYAAPTMNLGPNSVEKLLAPKVEVHDLRPDIKYMAGSPDGKLLALGTIKGLYIWDTDSREYIWSSDCMAVQRVRFSGSGRYLAAAGRGIPAGSSDVAVFDVDGFRRLPVFDWPEEDLRKKKTFHDIVFRPDEKSLLFAWHREWDQQQMTIEEALSVDRKEKDSRPNNSSYPELLCTEINLENGREMYSRRIDVLFAISDLRSEGSVYFSPNASHLLYPRHAVIEGSRRYKQAFLVDTNTWMGKKIELGEKYSIETRSGLMEWFECQIDPTGDYAYLLAAGYENLDVKMILLRLDLNTLQTEEIRSIPLTGSSWIRIALSPNGKQIALLGELESGNNSQSTGMAVLHIEDMERGESRRIPYKLKFPRSLLRDKVSGCRD